MKNLLVLFFSVMATASGCQTEKTPCIDKEKINPQAMCTKEYQPVCGCNQITYGNACEAENAGVTSWSEGECTEGTDKES